MSGDENSGDGKGIEIVLTEAAKDDGAGIADIGFGDLFGGEGLSDGNRAVEVVGVGGAEAGNFASGLRPGVANSEWVWTMPPMEGNSR